MQLHRIILLSMNMLFVCGALANMRIRISNITTIHFSHLFAFVQIFGLSLCETFQCICIEKLFITLKCVPIEKKNASMHPSDRLREIDQRSVYEDILNYIFVDFDLITSLAKKTSKKAVCVIYAFFSGARRESFNPVHGA